jgi:hypothetical protein
VALARWDRALGNGPDDALVAGAAVTLMPFTDSRPQPRQDRRVLRAYAWQQRRETPEEREALLRAEAERLAERVRAHLTSTDPAQRATLLVVAAPPGVGKSHAVAPLGAPTKAHPLTRTEPGLDRRAARHGAADSGARRLSADTTLHAAQLLGG